METTKSSGSTPYPSRFRAHSKQLPDGSFAPIEEWEPLFTRFDEAPAIRCSRSACPKCEGLEPNHGHLNKVAWWTSTFAGEMFRKGPNREVARQWGFIVGLWHDLGKFAPAWQAYLERKADIHSDELGGKVDHSTAGAAHANLRSPLGSLSAYLIAGHHAGLADGHTLFPTSGRLFKTIAPWQAAAESAGVPLDGQIPPPPLSRREAGNDAMAFMLRYFFSCLVDADFLATEAFMRLDRSSLRQSWPNDIIDQMLHALEDHYMRKFSGSDLTAVDEARKCVRLDCETKAEDPPGFFSLTVPTGGGKTLSSLLFALRHARKNRLRRVILVVPFTTIIKQNADVFREVFAPLSRACGREIVLEHHSTFDPSKETETNRLATENWDAPLIVTTNVRFFESMFANKTSACRKLHRTARSVVIFDEVQTLPNHLLAPILRGLRCLVHDLNSTVVLCTATQPALEKRDGFHVGIPPDEVTEIIRDKDALFETLDRVTVRNLGPLDDTALVSHLLDHASQGCLLILNTTKAARSLHEQLSAHVRALHLSARMCPRHVMLTLAQAKRLRRRGVPVVVVATQIVEAGVDISFPVVYRAESGLDSFAQAAGRCNRNGELHPAKGTVILFRPTDHPIPKGLADVVANAGITRTQIVPNFADGELLSLPAIRSYFEHAIWQAGSSTGQWDKHHVVSGDMACFDPRSRSIQSYSFKTAAKRFRLIESDTHAVFIPWGPKGRKLENEIRDLRIQNRHPNRGHYRRAQSFTVQVYDHEWREMQDRIELLCDGTFAVLLHCENYYHRDTGLKRPDSPDDLNAFCL
jgi:CRISPR-associated endonuclease/helicase Cas3